MAICFLFQLLYGLEWFCYVDHINQQVMHSQNYSIAAYTPYLPVAFHLVFSSNHPNRLQYPHSQFEVCHNYALLSHDVYSLKFDFTCYD